jgi:hypothetical protein
MAEDKAIQRIKKTIKEAMESEHIINIYGNGFICINSNADVVIIIKKNQKSEAIINLSYTTAKTLCEKLGQLIRDFEKTTGNTIMTINVIADKQKGSTGNDKLQ